MVRKNFEITGFYEVKEYNINKDQVKVLYTKNGKEQNAIFMRMGEEWKLLEDNHYAHNKLREKNIESINGLLGFYF